MSSRSARGAGRGRFSDLLFNLIFTFVFLIPALGLATLFGLQFSLALKIIIPLLFLAVALPLFWLFGVRFLLSDVVLKRLGGWVVLVAAFALPPLFILNFYNTYPAVAEAFIGIAGFLAVGVVLWGLAEIVGSFAATRLGRIIGWLFFAGVVLFPLFWTNYRQHSTKDINLLYGGVIGIFVLVMFTVGLRTLLRAIFKERVADFAVFLDRVVRVVLTAGVFFAGAIFPALFLTIKEGQSLTLGIFFLLCVPVIALFVHFNFLAEKHEL
ncbi:MAG: hypothetical protein ACE5OR_08805 [bacterium]